jgi:hypothetical protein
MTLPRIIFLDIDGVLNSGKSLHEQRRLDPDSRDWADMLDVDAVRLLNELILATGAKIVVSSTWRYALSLDELRDVLGRKGCVGEIVDVTPDRPSVMGRCRGDQIAEWLGCHFVGSWVILDDNSDMGCLSHRLVQTSFATGLRRRHIDAARRLLEQDCLEMQNDA